MSTTPPDNTEGKSLWSRVTDVIDPVKDHLDKVWEPIFVEYDQSKPPESTKNDAAVSFGDLFNLPLSKGDTKTTSDSQSGQATDGGTTGTTTGYQSDVPVADLSRVKSRIRRKNVSEAEED